MSQKPPAIAARDERFRDSISTVDKHGKRVWLYPKRPGGKFWNKRKVFGYTLLALLLLGPWLRIAGEPLLQLDVIDRRFVILGRTFWPQDIHLFVIGFITFIIFVALFTVAFGRLFCGWACPQTVFMELVYRRIEYAIEGDWKQQQALNKGPWNGERILKKTVKHFLFFAVAFFIGNTFLAYLIGSDRLLDLITVSPRAHWAGFVAMLGFSGIFYGVFAFMREQVCTTICPYGRLQGVLLDRHSTVIAYDHVRGETRSHFRKGEDRRAVGKGDCIDCKACVHVCPTGIDIRNGTQLECVNCTACIDACDHMMTSVGLPTGLIRFASEREIADAKPWRFTTRMKGYSAVLIALVGVLLTLILNRTDVEATVLRTPGTLFQKQQDGRVSNIYAYKVVNKTSRDMPIRFELENSQGEVQVVGKSLDLHKADLIEGELFIILPPQEIKSYSTLLTMKVMAGDKQVDELQTSFVGPIHKAQ